MITSENSKKLVLGDLYQPVPTPQYPHIKTYPKANIVLLPLNDASDHAGYQLTIEYQESEQSENHRHTEMLPLENGHFKGYSFSESIYPSDNIPNLFCTNTNKKYTFAFGEGQKKGFKVSITPDGKLTCEGAGINTLSFDTPNDITLSDPIKTEQFYCKCKNLEIHNELKGKLIGLESERLNNHGNIHSKRIEIKAQNRLLNTGIINADIKVKIYSKGLIINENKISSDKGSILIEGISKLKEGVVSIEENSNIERSEVLNKGLIHADKIQCVAKKLFNEKTILANELKSNLFSKASDITFMNDGQVTGLNLINIETNGIMLIDTKGQCESNQKINVQAGLLKNRGNLQAKEIHTFSREFHNSLSGKIISEAFVIGTTGNATNLGYIQAKDCYLFTDVSGTFSNNGHFLLSEMLQATVLGDVKNSGNFAAKNLKIACGQDIIQNNRSRLSGSQKIHLDSNRNTSLMGTVESGLISMKSGGNTELSGCFKGKNIQVKTKQDLKTSGIIEGDEAYFEALGNFVNTSNMAMTRDIKIIAENITNLGNQKAGQQISLKATNNINQLGRLTSLKAIALQAEGNILNKNHIKTKALSLNAKGTVRNESEIQAETITTEGYLIDNLVNGIILAAKRLEMKGDVIQNLGTLLAGSLSLEGESLITNKSTGLIVSIEVKLTASHILSNLGKIISDETTLKAGHWLENALNAEIKAKRLNAESSYSFDNFGKIESGELYLQALNFLRNHQEGLIAAETLAQFKTWALNNSGNIAVQNLKADVLFIIENSGKIKAEEAIELINACLVQNLGTLSSRKITIHAKEIINNMTNGDIQAEELLYLLANFALENSSILAAEQMHLQAHQLLFNDGSAIAKEMKLQTEGLCLNNNLLQADQLSIKADCLMNLKNGKINAKKALEIIVKQNIEQEGSIEARSGFIQALNLNITGEMTLKELSINIQNNFNLCKEGKITVEDSVYVMTKNLCLIGQLMGQGRISFNIENDFQYNEEMIWACEVLHLLIQQGYDFTKPLESLKSIEIETSAGNSIIVQNKITTGKNLSITSGVIDILKTGECHAGRNILLNAFSRITNSNQITAGWNATIKGHLFHNKATVDVGNTLKLDVKVFKNEQQTTLVEEEVIVNKKVGAVKQTLVKELPNTGIVKAKTIIGNCDEFYQIGGELYSGEGGTSLVIKDKALIQALRTTNAVQGEITRRGNNFQIEPEFVPARLTSLGNQTFIVLAGDFNAIGMKSSAAKINSIEALNGNVTIQHAYEQFDLASTDKRSGFAGTKHIKTGGTGFSNLPSQVEGGEGVNIVAHEGAVKVIASMIYSGGDANIKAKHLVAILNGIAETSFYNSTEKFKGFGYHAAKVKGTEQTVLPSQLVICGNLTLNAAMVHLKAVQGLIQGDLSIEAINVLIEGAVVTDTVVSKNESITVDFFGSEVIESVMRGKNAKQALKEMMKSQSPSFINSLKTIAHSKDNGEKITEATKSFIQGWRLSAMVAHACNETNADPKVSELCGSLTDNLGITTSTKDTNGNVQRKFNPEFRFTHSKSTTIQSSTRTMPSTLMIGGNLHIVADVVKIMDGAQICANNITIIAKQLLEICAAQNTESLQHTSNSESVSVKSDGTFVGGGFSEASQFSDCTTYNNALLKANGVLSILSERTVSLVGAELEARNVLIKASELIVKSLQDSYREDKDSFSVSAGADFSVDIKTAEESTESLKVNRPSSIRANETLDLFVNSIVQVGSILSSGESVKIQNLMGGNSVQWQASDLVDHEKTTAFKSEFSLKPNDTFPLTAFVNSKKQVKSSKANATFAAKNVDGVVPGNVNRELNNVHELISEVRKSMGVAFVMPNVAKLKEDSKSMREAFSRLMDRVSPSQKPQVQKLSNMQKALESRGISEHEQQQLFNQPEFVELIQQPEQQVLINLDDLSENNAQVDEHESSPLEVEQDILRNESENPEQNLDSVTPLFISTRRRKSEPNIHVVNNANNQSEYNLFEYTDRTDKAIVNVIKKGATALADKHVPGFKAGRKTLERLEKIYDQMKKGNDDPKIYVCSAAASLVEGGVAFLGVKGVYKSAKIIFISGLRGGPIGFVLGTTGAGIVLIKGNELTAYLGENAAKRTEKACLSFWNEMNETIENSGLNSVRK